MNKHFLWIAISLFFVIWLFFLFWKINIKERVENTTALYPKVVEELQNDTIPLTNLRIKNKIIKLDGIKEGVLTNARYIIYNTGSNPLFIEYVNPDCSCTGYEVSDSITYPGDSLEIVLKFNSAGKIGANFMNAVVKANTPVALYKLSFMVNVTEK